MKRGISFIICQKEDHILWKILSSINIEKYNWFNIENQNESYLCEDELGEEPFLGNTIYNGHDFAKRIIKDHYIIFLKLEAYEGKTNSFNIHSYEEFQKSSCQLLLLINDCTFVEIYAKDQIIMDTIYKNAQKYGFTEVEYIYDNNDERKNMDVL